MVLFVCASSGNDSIGNIPENFDAKLLRVVVFLAVEFSTGVSLGLLDALSFISV
jgi:hypothetical protein